MRSDSSQGGMALLPALIVFALLGVAAINICFKSDSMTRLMAGALHGRRADLRAVERAAGDYLLALGSASSARRFCVEGRGSAGISTAYRRVCVLVGGRVGTANAYPPVLDYHSIFSALDICQTIAVPPADRSVFGLPLSPGAVSSALLCSDPPLLPDFRVNANYAAHTELRAGGLLAATGYVDIRGKLYLGSDATIVAGGDLYIADVQSDSASLVKLTLLSATGSIMVERVGTGLELAASSRQGVYLPAGTAVSDEGDFPPSFAMLPIGMSTRAD